MNFATTKDILSSRSVGLGPLFHYESYLKRKNYRGPKNRRKSSYLLAVFRFGESLHLNFLFFRNKWVRTPPSELRKVALKMNRKSEIIQASDRYFQWLEGRI